MVEREQLSVGRLERYGNRSKSDDISTKRQLVHQPSAAARRAVPHSPAARSETVVRTRNAGGRSTRFDSCRYVIIFIRAPVIDHVVVRRAIIE